MESFIALPSEIIVNPEDKTVVVTPEVTTAFPDVSEAFKKVDEAFWYDTEANLTELEESVFSFRSQAGLESRITCSLIQGQKVGDELLVVYAPFSDGAPKSSAEDIWRYMKAQQPISKAKAAPNSWSQTTKSGVLSELLKAINHDMPVLTIFSPVPSHAYSTRELQDFRRGDYSPAARITTEAVAMAQEWLHGQDSETQISKLHLHGASLGASNAVGAASGLLESYDVRSVTAQELILGPKNIFPDLASKFTVKGTVGETSQLIVPSDYARIAEPVMRRMIDRDGYELATFGRMANGMSKRSYLKGLTKPNERQNDIRRLLEKGVPLVVALAENSGLTQDTEKYLPSGGEDVVHVRAESGHRANHLIDEHVGLTALITALNIRRSR